MSITALPTPPSRSDPTNFANRGDAFLGALPTFATEANLLAAAVNANDVSAAASAAAASAASAAAVSTANVTAWTSGNTYAVGNNVYSPITFLTYRRKTAGAGTTDPSADSTNWQLVTGQGDATLAGTQTFTGDKTYSGTVSYSGTLTGLGLIARFSSPGPIGNTLRDTGAFTNVLAKNTTGADSYITVDTSSLSQGSFVRWGDAGNPRWTFFKDGTSESGFNAGSNFAFNAYLDSGSQINVFTVIRSTGKMYMSSASNPSAGDNTQQVATTAYAYFQAFGGATWQELGPSGSNIRFKGTTYTNSTGRAICVNVDMQSGGDGSRMKMTIGGVAVYGSVSQYGNGFGSLWIVPPGGTYKLEDVFRTNSVNSWQELRT